MSDWGEDHPELNAVFAPDPDEATTAEPEPRKTYYANLDDFVRLYLREAYARPINGRTRVWAAEWWKYPEAVSRLDALWRAWEHLRLDPSAGMSVWYRDHADHHMATLMDPDGPFCSSRPERRVEHISPRRSPAVRSAARSSVQRADLTDRASHDGRPALSDAPESVRGPE